ncbi:hypothetical protein HMPREF0294_0011 [Corynebacterium glucuronolyticum ATCC 51867]|uniref:Lipoprotein n=1 Tax=Corynebacterium glucuronolyticum ATCC 51866 TaxID=548478 RepID=A0ABM9XQC7_9CORY|nr:hypothetical protein HMPREF0294_0011 [Corynebacterium glucuronolyticum ATCC 51867]EEI63391.1 hypothetical protein HMPREF0293_1295 [Corynebacterium glucuronolyticum ATCC 51866]
MARAASSPVSSTLFDAPSLAVGGCAALGSGIPTKSTAIGGEDVTNMD